MNRQGSPTDGFAAQAAISQATTAELAACGHALIETERRPTQTLVAVFGRLDLRAAIHVEDSLKQAACEDGHEVILDLTAVEDLDPGALRMLARHQGHGRHDQQVVLRIAPHQAAYLI